MPEVSDTKREELEKLKKKIHTLPLYMIRPDDRSERKTSPKIVS